MIPFFRPEALEIWGPIKIQPWGVLVASSFILATLVSQRYARKRGVDPRHYSDIIIWMAAGGIFFSHIGHALLYEPAHYLSKPWELLYIWEGRSSIGGIAGCTVVAIVFFRRRKLDVLESGDLAEGDQVSRRRGHQGAGDPAQVAALPARVAHQHGDVFVGFLEAGRLDAVERRAQGEADVSLRDSQQGGAVIIDAHAQFLLPEHPVVADVGDTLHLCHLCLDDFRELHQPVEIRPLHFE